MITPDIQTQIQTQIRNWKVEGDNLNDSEILIKITREKT